MGQLTCLTHFYPTPMRLCETLAPRVYAWVERLEDLSGYEVGDQDWLAQTNTLPDSLLALLSEVARTHIPQLIANARAVLNEEKAFATEIDGQTWEQPSFPYQLKCLRWTREEFETCSADDQATVRVIIQTTGLSPLIDAELPDV